MLRRERQGCAGTQGIPLKEPIKGWKRNFQKKNHGEAYTWCLLDDVDQTILPLGITSEQHTGCKIRELSVLMVVGPQADHSVS